MKTEKQRIIHNASWIIVCRIAQSILSLVVSMIMARYLGPAYYGTINYASSVVAFAVPIVQLGFNSILVQELVDTPDREGDILGTAIFTSIITSILGIIGIAAFALIVNKGETETIIVCILYSISLIFQMTEMIQYWYQARLLSKYTSLTMLVARFIISAYKIYLIISAKNIYWFALVNAIDYLIISIVLFVIYKKLSGQSLCFKYDVLKRMFAKSKYYILSSMMVVIFGHMDRIMIKLMLGDAETGFYSAAITCTGMTAFVFVAVLDSFRPIIFGHKKNSVEKYKRDVVSLYSIIIYMALAQSLFLTIFGKFVVNILYGVQYANTVNILRIITWYSAFSYMGSVRNIWLLAEGKQKYLWFINLLGAIVNVFGNLLLIPIWGACGAAVASVVTQTFTNFALCFIIKELRPAGHMIIESLNPKVLVNIGKSIIKK